jgi:hypothetical protein
MSLRKVNGNGNGRVRLSVESLLAGIALVSAGASFYFTNYGAQASQSIAHDSRIGALEARAAEDRAAAARITSEYRAELLQELKEMNRGLAAVNANVTTLSDRMARLEGPRTR